MAFDKALVMRQRIQPWLSQKNSISHQVLKPASPHFKTQCAMQGMSICTSVTIEDLMLFGGFDLVSEYSQMLA